MEPAIPRHHLWAAVECYLPALPLQQDQDKS